MIISSNPIIQISNWGIFIALIEQKNLSVGHVQISSQNSVNSNVCLSKITEFSNRQYFRTSSLLDFDAAYIANLGGFIPLKVAILVRRTAFPVILFAYTNGIKKSLLKMRAAPKLKQ